jgi:hypothetical protein
MRLAVKVASHAGCGKRMRCPVALPVHTLAFGANDHAVGDFFAMHANPARPVALNGLNVKIVWF